MSTRPPEVKVVEVPVPKADPPLAFQVALVSLALFAGPALLALVVGLIAICAWTCGAVVGMVRQGVGP